MKIRKHANFSTRRPIRHFSGETRTESPFRGSPYGSTPVIAAMMVLGISGCGGHRSTDTLPTAPGSSVSSPGRTTASSPAPRDAAIAAYKAFLAAANRAIFAPKSRARDIISPYATGDFLEFQLRQVAVHQKANEEPWGKAVVHITRVDVTGSQAAIHDCQDDSHAGLADRRTHALIEGSLGTSHQKLVANLIVGGDSKWRVSGLRLYPGSCHVTSS
jgi:hypothetical protein